MSSIQPDPQQKNVRLYLFLGGLSVVAIFVLFSFGRSVVEQGLEASRSELATEIADTVGENRNVPLGAPAVLAVDPVRQYGNNTASPAELTIIEYGDFQCPYCADMADTLAEVLTQYPAVRLVWKDLPNPVHFEARAAAHAARCAQDQGVFWEYHDALFAGQSELSEELYAVIATELGLDMVQFTTCMSDQSHGVRIDVGVEDAEQYRITATPFLFVGTHRVDKLITADELASIIDAQLNVR